MLHQWSLAVFLLCSPVTVDGKPVHALSSRTYVKNIHGKLFLLLLFLLPPPPRLLLLLIIQYNNNKTTTTIMRMQQVLDRKAPLKIRSSSNF